MFLSDGIMLLWTIWERIVPLSMAKCDMNGRDLDGLS